MKHLSNREILDFLKIASFDAESSSVVKRVNCHISGCADCAAKVRRASKYYDAVTLLSKDDFSFDAIPVSEYDIEREEVTAAAKELFETKKNVTRI